MAIAVQDGHMVAVADAAVAMEMASSCIQGAILLTEANLSGITDIEYVKQKRKFLEGLKTEAADLYLRAKEELSQRL